MDFFFENAGNWWLPTIYYNLTYHYCVLPTVNEYMFEQSGILIVLVAVSHTTAIGNTSSFSSGLQYRPKLLFFTYSGWFHPSSSGLVTRLSGRPRDFDSCLRVGFAYCFG